MHIFWLKVPLSVRQSLSRIEARKRNSISEAVDLLKCYLPFLLSNSSTANFSQYSCEDYLCPHNKKVFSVENWRHSYFWYDLRLYIWAWLGSNQRPIGYEPTALTTELHTHLWLVAFSIIINYIKKSSQSFLFFLLTKLLYHNYIYAEVVELVDTYVSGAYVERHGGSSPLLSIFWKWKLYIL